MADIGQLETALRNADAAGDTEAAKTLAAEIIKMRGGAIDPSKPSVAADVAKSGGIGMAKGAIGLVGGVGDVSSLINSGMAWAEKKIRGETGEQAAQREARINDARKGSTFGLNLQPTSSDIQKSVEGVTGEFYKPQTTAGKYAQSVGEMVPATMIGPGGLVRKGIQAVGSGVGAEAAGEATEGTKLEPYARVAGALIGGYAPDMLRKIATPNPISPERQRLVNVLNDEGVTSLTAGQKTGNKSLQYAEDFLGNAPFAGGKAREVQQEGQRQFTDAVMRRAGAGPDATPEVLSKNYQRLGNQFEDIASRNVLAGDAQLGLDIGRTLREYDKVLPAAQKKIVGDLVVDLVDKFKSGGGNISGVEYQAARSRLSRMANNARVNDPDFSEALRGVRDALDNGFRRSVKPEDAALLGLTRKQYGAQKTIEKAASRAGEATAEGQIVPTNLRNTVASGNNRGAYARGEGDFSELARAGSGIMAPLPNSGTAQRNALISILNAATLGAVPAVAGRTVMSRPVQSYLGNQLIGAPTQEVRKSARLSNVVNALLAARH